MVSHKLILLFPTFATVLRPSSPKEEVRTTFSCVPDYLKPSYRLGSSDAECRHNETQEALGKVPSTTEDELVVEYGDSTVNILTTESSSNLPAPLPSCNTYPRKSGSRKRNRCKHQCQMKKDPPTRDILAQLDDEIEEQEMDKRSRIELLSYLDAAIKNKNVELNLELRHLAKEEEILNQREQENADTDRNVMTLNSNIDQLSKRIKDLESRIAKMNKLRAEQAAREHQLDIQQVLDSQKENPALHFPNFKVPDSVLLDGKQVQPLPEASFPILPTTGPNRLGPNVLSQPLNGPYMDPYRVYGDGYPPPEAIQQPTWYPMWGVNPNQRWDAMYPSKWGPYPDNRRLGQLYTFLPRQPQPNRGFQFDPGNYSGF